VEESHGVINRLQYIMGALPGGRRRAICIGTRSIAEINTHQFSLDLDLKSHRIMLEENEAGEFVPPKGLVAVNITTGEKDCCWHVGRRKPRQAIDQIVRVAVVESHSHGIRRQRAGHEHAHKFRKRKSATAATQDLELFFEVSRRYRKAPIIDRLIGDTVVHENQRFTHGSVRLTARAAIVTGNLGSSTWRSELS